MPLQAPKVISPEFEPFAYYALNHLAVRGELRAYDLKKLVQNDFSQEEEGQEPCSIATGSFYAHMDTLENEGCVISEQRQPEKPENRDGQPDRYFQITQGGLRKRAELSQKEFTVKLGHGFPLPELG